MNFTEKRFYVCLICCFSILTLWFSGADRFDWLNDADALVSKDAKVLEVTSVICSRLFIVDEQNRAVISMLAGKQHGTVGGIIMITDVDEPLAEGKKTGTHFTMTEKGFRIYNSKGEQIVRVGTVRDGGLMLLYNKDREPTWGIEANRLPSMLE